MHPASDTELTCVLADDHSAVRSAVRRQLDRIGWTTVVSEAVDGADALARIEELRPDVAILDVRMPKLSGFDVCARIQELGLPTRVVLYSALASPENVALGERMGAAAFVSKDGGFAPLRDVLERIATDLSR